MNNYKKQKITLHTDKSVSGTSFQGIIPDLETLEHLEKLSPGATKLWLEIAKEEIKTRQINESRITWTFKVSTILSQFLSFITGISVLSVGVYALYLGHATAAATIITGSTATIIAAFYFKNKAEQ